MGIAEYLTCLLRNLYAGQEATVRTWRGITGSKLGKEYNKAVYCHSVYLTSMQSTSWKMLGWMNHKLDTRLPGETSASQICKWYHSNAESEEELKSLLMKVKEESEKAGLKLSIQPQVHMCPPILNPLSCGWFLSMYGKSHHNIVK